MANYASRAILPDNPLDLSDREDLFRKWLEAHGIPEPWVIASVVAESPMTIAHLEELAAMLSPETLAVSAAAFASSLRVERMAETVINSTVRIFDLISAIKDYSYMDQAPIQEIDIAQSLDTTLTMFASRLEHVTVERRYDPALPHISAYGSELNQVWTELIANALDAMARKPSEDDPPAAPSASRPHPSARWSPSKSGTTAPASPPRSSPASSSPSTPPSPRPGSRPRPRLRQPHRHQTQRHRHRRIQTRSHLLPGPPPHRTRPGLLVAADQMCQAKRLIDIEFAPRRNLSSTGAPISTCCLWVRYLGAPFIAVPPR
jgi:hypothetical protein